MIVALLVTSRFLHESVATGAQGMMFFLYAIPGLTILFVVCVVISRNFAARSRLISMTVTILLASGVWTMVRSNGITGDFMPLLTWRWTKTAEERLLAATNDPSTPLMPSTLKVEIEADWPGFRGPNRDGKIHGVSISTDWSKSPPKELWRRPIGPGCSSVAVKGSFLYTQEQRGEDEIVACYHLANGKPVWSHRDKCRFWDSHAGAGPRGTPTLSNGRVYTLGATGILNVLDGKDGAVIWSRNAVSDTGVKIPEWGITSSPLVVDDVVIIATVGKLVAYDLATGKLRWSGPDGKDSFSSPHLLTIDGVEQILMMSKVGANSFAAVDGSQLWEYSWGEGRIVQPALAFDGDLILSTGQGKGMRRLTVTRNPQGWKVQEHWSSSRLRPNFNDFVVHQGYAFGFNGANLTCIDLKDGKRKWKGERYGGQLILLADQNLLLILTEKGKLALVKAMPERFSELASFPAIEGKTWNHPTLAGNLLIVRNTQEMAAFRLSPY